jgi:hypothetical protein
MSDHVRTYTINWRDYIRGEGEWSEEALAQGRKEWAERLAKKFWAQWEEALWQAFEENDAKWRALRDTSTPHEVAAPASSCAEPAVLPSERDWPSHIKPRTDHGAAPTAGASMRECTTPVGIGGTCESLSGSLPADLGDGVSPSENNKNLHHTEVRNGIADGGETVSQPVAWMVALGGDGLIIDGIFLRRTQAEEACAWRNEHTTYGARIIPLYEKPQTCPHVVGRTTQYCSLTPFTLTDAEREAVDAAARIIDGYDEEMDGFPSGAAATLRSLLERTT